MSVLLPSEVCLEIDNAEVGAEVDIRELDVQVREVNGWQIDGGEGRGLGHEIEDVLQQALPLNGGAVTKYPMTLNSGTVPCHCEIFSRGLWFRIRFFLIWASLTLWGIDLVDASAPPEAPAHGSEEVPGNV